MKYLSIAIVLVFAVSSCSTTKDSLFSQDASLDELHRLMIGSYNSGDQARLDSTYYDITLHMYPIWNNDMSAKWLYVEQAVTANPKKPYRQRVYKLKTNADGSISSYVYTLDNPEEYVGKWETPSYFDSKEKSILIIREGCEVIMRKDGKTYKGSTGDKTCGSTMRGASYASSMVTLNNKMISSWDQGFDADGVQVWGATEGPYIFKKY